MWLSKILLTTFCLLFLFGCFVTGEKLYTQYGACYENPYYYQDLPDEWYQWEKYNWYHSCNRLRSANGRPGLSDGGGGQPGEVVIERGMKNDLFYSVDKSKNYHYSNPIIRNFR